MASAETITVTMTTDMLRTIRESVASGDYASTSDALSDAIRVWQRQRAEASERFAAIKARIRHSLDDPRPDLTSADVQIRLNTLYALVKADAERA